MANAGTPLEWMEPLRRYTTELGDTDPQRRPQMKGCYSGKFMNMNILNALPRHIYYYPRATEADVTKFVVEGWHICDPKKGDPERLATPSRVADLPFAQHQGTNLTGGLAPTHEHILMRIHEDDFRQIAEAKLRRNKAQLEEADQDFMERGQQLADQAGTRAHTERGSLYYSTPGHGFSRGPRSK